MEDDNDTSSVVSFALHVVLFPILDEVRQIKTKINFVQFCHPNMWDHFVITTIRLAYVCHTSVTIAGLYKSASFFCIKLAHALIIQCFMAKYKVNILFQQISPNN